MFQSNRWLGTKKKFQKRQEIFAEKKGFWLPNYKTRVLLTTLGEQQVHFSLKLVYLETKEKIGSQFSVYKLFGLSNKTIYLKKI
jgi:hypothetical protein